MKKILLLLIIVLAAFPAISQKVTIGVSRSNESTLSFWQITDINSQTIFSANGHLNEDTVRFTLDAFQLYSLQITVPETNIPFRLNYTLEINGEAVLHINEQSVAGEHSFQFFTGMKKAPAKITGGTTASIADFPWQVYFISGNYRCGGSIISPDWVITAAHCTETDAGAPIPFNQMFVVVGADNPSTSGATYKVSEAIAHESYNSTTLENDIAVLHLQTPISYANATPIKLINSIDVINGATLPGVMAWVTGWGLTHVSPDALPTKLQKLQLPIVSNAQASTVWSSIPSTDIMAGYLNGNKDACNGDSGGPLAVPLYGEYKLAGIVSWGSTSCNTYGAYTKVSAFESWIALKTGITAFSPSSPAGPSTICNVTDTSLYLIDPYPLATSYDWKLYPANAGTITGKGLNASVIWNSSFSGSLAVLARVTVNGIVSDWSKTSVVVAPETKLLSKSADTTLCALQPITLQASASGYKLSYKWYKNGTLYQSGSSNVVSYSLADPLNSGIYRCDITSACGSLTSGNISMTVLPVTRVKYLTPDTVISFGYDASLKVNSEGHNLSYQWQKDGSILAGGDAANLPLPAVNTSDIGQYQVIVNGTCGTLTSDSVYVYVKRKESATVPDVFVWPTITSQNVSIASYNDSSYTIRLYNTSGVLLREVKDCRYQTNLYLGTLPRDIYILRIFNSDFNKSYKIIKK